jgi:hypothetical protein
MQPGLANGLSVCDALFTKLVASLSVCRRNSTYRMNTSCPGLGLAAAVSARLVCRDDHALGRDHAVGELEIDTRSAIIEKTVTLTEHERVDEQHIPVDELRRKQ